MRSFLGVVFFGATSLLFAQKVAITIDDAPFGFSAGMSGEEQVKIFDGILNALDKYDIKATFFITTSNLKGKNSGILDMAIARGHQMGNHTDDHLNLNTVSAATYIADIRKCSDKGRKWINSEYFRYSYLRRGDTRQKRDSVYTALDQMGLVIAPVTIDNSEWEYNRDFSRALSKGNQQEMDAQANAYLLHMAEWSNRYRNLGMELLGREVSHILLIHSNPINSYYLEDLLDWYAQEGWAFVSLDDAMKDEIYRLEDDYVGPNGISVLDRIKD